MRDEFLYADHPVALPQGMSLAGPGSDGLRFSRSYHAPLDAVIAHWTDPLHRRVWLKPMKASRFAITHAAPACLEAMETDDLHMVRAIVNCEDEGEFTMVRILIQPIAPLTTATLVASGYADQWEERLYALTDALLNHHT